MFIVSPPGIHISLGICVWGYTYHGDTHITVIIEFLFYYSILFNLPNKKMLANFLDFSGIEFLMFVSKSVQKKIKSSSCSQILVKT